MSDAYIEFLTENSQRRYPFSEDCSLSDGAYSMDNGIVLDVRGFSRQRPDTDLYLESIFGGGAGTVAGHSALPGNWSLIFRAGVDQILRIDIPYANTSWPKTCETSIQDSEYVSENPLVLAASLRVTIGEAISEIGDTDSHVFSALAAPVEPGLFVSLYRNVIDFIKVVHSDATPDDIVGGKVKVYGGYNAYFLQTTFNNILRAFAEVGGGTLGKNLAPSIPPSENICDKVVQAINGLGPNEDGAFSIEAGTGIKVENFPFLHKVVVTINPSPQQSGTLNCP